MTEEPTLNAETLISLHHAAKLMDISQRGLYRLIANGDIPKPVKVGRSSKLFRSDLKVYFDSLKANR